MARLSKDVLKYLQSMVKAKASDLYITKGQSPMMRVGDKILPAAVNVLGEKELNDILEGILSQQQRTDFAQDLELNLSLDVDNVGRFRVNVMRQKAHPAFVIRRVISDIPSLEDLSLPELLGDLALESRGLILVTGVTGSGKSTTLASMLGVRNKTLPGHIVTIEDPIEYFHEHGKSIVTQREIGIDTHSYHAALKNVLRQRPDAIMVGEIRDRETMEQALTAAETGHLCLSTLHTRNAVQSIERIINLFPEEQHRQVRMNLALNLRAIIAQRLVKGEGGYYPVLEIMLNEGAVKDYILEGKIQDITDVIENNKIKGMCSFDQSLLTLLEQNLIGEDVAKAESDNPADMAVKIRSLTGLDEG